MGGRFVGLCRREAVDRIAEWLTEQSRPRNATDEPPKTQGLPSIGRQTPQTPPPRPSTRCTTPTRTSCWAPPRAAARPSAASSPCSGCGRHTPGTRCGRGALVEGLAAGLLLGFSFEPCSGCGRNTPGTRCGQGGGLEEETRAAALLLPRWLDTARPADPEALKHRKRQIRDRVLRNPSPPNTNPSPSSATASKRAPIISHVPPQKTKR